MSGAATGSSWNANLRFVAYNSQGKVDHRSDNANLDTLVSLLKQGDDPEATKFVSVRVFANKLKFDGLIRLCCPCFYEPFQQMLKHHFVEIHTREECFTLEKTDAYFLLQKSSAVGGRASATSASVSNPTARSMIDGKRRITMTEELQVVVEDIEPKVSDMLERSDMSCRVN